MNTTNEPSTVDHGTDRDVTARNATRPARPRVVHVPRVDIHESAEGFLVIADLPGVAQDDVEITVEKNVLTVSARAEARAPEGYQMLFGADPVEEYRRAFTLTDAVDREGITATMKHGTLRLSLPKAKAARPRRISVQSAG